MSFSETPEADALGMATRMSGKSDAATLQAQADQAARIALELAEQARTARKAELEASRPKQPDVVPSINGMPTATVLFTRYQAGRSYGYAAVAWRDGHHVRWAVTGQETRRFNWPGLLAFIGEANWHTLHVVSDLSYIGPPEGAEPPVAEEMARYGRVRRTVPVYDEQDRP